MRLGTGFMVVDERVFYSAYVPFAFFPLDVSADVIVMLLQL